MGDSPDQPLPSPKAAGQGEPDPAAGPPGPQQSCGHGGFSTFPPSPTGAPGSPGLWEVPRGRSGGALENVRSLAGPAA